MTTTTKKKIQIWFAILLILCAIPNLSPTGLSGTSFAAQGQAVKEEELVHEVAKIPQLYNYSALGLAYVPEGASDIIVSGTIKELKNRAFDFYAFNKLNYERWQAGVSYQAYVEPKKVTAYSLSISPTREDVNDGLRLVVSNVYLQETMETSLIDETMRIGLFENWDFQYFFPPFMLGYSAELTVKGTAKETYGYRFNLYVLDRENLDLWSAGRSYDAFYEGKRRGSYEFSFVVPQKKSSESLWFVVERAEPNEALVVDVTATGTWLGPAELAVEYDVKVSWKEKALGCFIATAAYGSELEPQVQFIRDFRDRTVAPTVIGSSFLSIFNPFYYSFSPQVASLISMHQPVRELVKYLLYPLVGAIRVASCFYLVFSFNDELAVATALFTSVLLVGIVYFLPVALAVKSALSRRQTLVNGDKTF